MGFLCMSYPWASAEHGGLRQPDSPDGIARDGGSSDYACEGSRGPGSGRIAFYDLVVEVTLCHTMGIGPPRVKERKQTPPLRGRYVQVMSEEEWVMCELSM